MNYRHREVGIGLKSWKNSRGSSRYEEKSRMRAKRRYITRPAIIYDPRGWNYPGPDIVGIYQSRAPEIIFLRVIYRVLMPRTRF